MSTGVERRSQIDSETVRGLQLLNGGMAAGLVAMLPSILLENAYVSLSRFMIVAVGMNALGLVASVVHNRLRRKCSLEYSKKKENRAAAYTSWFLKRCQSVPDEPGV